MNATGTSTTYDALGTQNGATMAGAASLMVMPPSADASPNDLGIYLFWQDGVSVQLR